MSIPFVFGRVVGSPDFTDREQEMETLVQHFESGTHCILISPRRWGKSSLVYKAGEALAKRNKKIAICHLDLFTVRTAEEFYQQLAEQVLKATHSRIEKMVETIRAVASQIIPRISYNVDDTKALELGLDWEAVRKKPGDVLDLAERVAISKAMRIVICIDEFQNLSFFKQPLAFQKQLRAVWQKHKHVTYCLYGSKRHMMTEIFTHPAMPFYKFGSVMFLEKISEANWLNFLQQRFTGTGKKIQPAAATQLVALTEAHPYYVQQLAQLSWLRTSRTCTPDIVEAAFESLILQLSNLFQMITDGLSNTQVNFLEAVVNKEERFSTKKVITHYKLGTTANVARIKQALTDKEIIDEMHKQVTLLDPVYNAWLQRYYFGRRK